MDNTPISISIEYNNNEYRTLTFYPNSNSQKVAYEYCKSNNLDFDSMILLGNKIKEYQSQYLKNTSSSKNKNLNIDSQKNNSISKQSNTNTLVNQNKNNILDETDKKKNESELISPIKPSQNTQYRSNKKAITKNKNQDNKSGEYNNKSNSSLKKSNSKSINIENANKLFREINKQYATSVNKNKINRYNNTTKSSNVKNISSIDDNNKLNMNSMSINKSISSYGKLNTGERLYRKEIKFLEKTKKKIENELNKSLDKTLYTFQPKTNPIPYNVMFARMTNHKACNDEYNILNYKSFRENQIENLKIKHNLNEDFKKNQYSFQPKIDNNSKKLDKESRIKRLSIKKVESNQKNSKSKNKNYQYTEESNKRYINLYNSAIKRDADIKELTNQIYDKKKLFKPKINKDYVSQVDKMPFMKRQNFYNSKSIEKKRILTERVLTEEACKCQQFKANYDIMNDNEFYDVFDKLYNKADFYKQKKEILSKQLLKQSNPNLKYTDIHSNNLLNNKKQKCFEKMFHLLDKNKTGTITKNNIDLEKLSYDIQKMFDPIIKELNEEDQTMNIDEFVSVCNKLYDSFLNYNERKIFVGFDENKKNIKQNKIKAIKNDMYKKEKINNTFHPTVNEGMPNFNKNTKFVNMYRKQKFRRKEINKEESESENDDQRKEDEGEEEENEEEEGEEGEEGEDDEERKDGNNKEKNEGNNQGEEESYEMAEYENKDVD